MIVWVFLDGNGHGQSGNDLLGDEIVLQQLNKRVFGDLERAPADQRSDMIENAAHSAVTRPACEWFA